ncbi:ATP dependent DNA ligase domain-containing protein [Hirsutella rhossiliensis]|uniref:DNA ligase n=1 Tax=Hirsutella rhossiliensis TaxID=111463 RepID=A0A9P8MRB4_9HYPO|nr:ATP dependent DNA ligase domain-containing protein [Hirsutella rhossiliensis]KAH0959739.1 ATP dependent DNA ligase domain-containing protein [Hirsutella rhossiliensis]
MSSPLKKKKLNNGTKSAATQPKGLEYFFLKQKGNGSAVNEAPSEAATELTDEELARKLQAEWDLEAANEAKSEDNGLRGEAGDANPGSPRKSMIFRAKANPPAADVAESKNPDPPARTSKSTLSLQSAGMAEDEVNAFIPLDESPLTFDSSKYVSQLREHWAATTSRIKIVDTLVNCLRVLIEGDFSSLLPAVWLATNSISPPYISMELGLGGSAISKALRQVCGLDNRALKAIYDKYGDAGDVAFEAKKKQSFTLRKPKPLTIKGVYQSLVKIATSQGQGSNEAKQRIVDRLLQDARGGEESRFIVRTLCQHLRIGAVKTTMLIALSRAFLLSRPPAADYPLKSVSGLSTLRKDELAEVWGKAEETVKACFARRPNYNDLIPVLLETGVTQELLVRCDLTLHIPLRPMLGSITRDLSEMLTKLQGRDFACEFKYDGQRAQIHCDEQGKVSIFSRHLELMTDKYPDLVELVPRIRGEGVGSFIMEGEVVAVDRETGALKNFQALTNRARKDVAIDAIKVDVCLFSFDLMYLNGQPLLDRPFRERRELLRSLFVEIPHHFTWVKSLDATSGDSEAVLEFFKSATDSKCEGIMVKILDNLPAVPYLGDVEDTGPAEAEKLSMPKSKSKFKQKPKSGGTADTDDKKPKSRRKPLLATYEPDKRLDSWLKVKKDYNSSFDTLDLIPVAGWHGQGRKAMWWSPILLAVRNEESGSLEAICKCMSGFTDAFYKANKAFYDEGAESGESKNTRLQKPSFVEYSGPRPDVWFEPQEVWEMAFADITLSPTYTAAIGLVSDERGLSLRFPRFLKKREDKSIDEASTSEFLAGLWRKQEAKASTDKDSKEEPVQEYGDDEDHE